MDKRPYKIVTLDPSDWKKYKKLRLLALQHEPQAFGSRYVDNVNRPDEYWQWRLRMANQEKTSWILFAEKDNRLIGMISSSQIPKTFTAEIISLYVIKEERNKGIAKELMQNLLQVIQQNRSVQKVTLTVNIEQKQAFLLYKTMGFEIQNEKNEKMGEWLFHKQVVMERLMVQSKKGE